MQRCLAVSPPVRSSSPVSPAAALSPPSTMTEAPPQLPAAPAQPADPGTTALLEREPVLDPAEPGDHERFAHYVRKEKILESAMTGEPVIALCGKVWIPGRDPQRFPVCPTCKEVFEGLRPAGDGRGGGGKGGNDGGGNDAGGPTGPGD